MVRFGIHYVEPRRVGFFLGEELAAAAAFVGCAMLLAHGQRAPVGPLGLVALGLAVACAIAFGLSLADLHDLRVSLDEDAGPRRLYRVLGGVSLVAAAGVFLVHDRPEAAPIAAGVMGAALALVGTRAALQRLGRDRALHTRVFLVGEGAAAHRLAREITRDDGVDVVGFCASNAVDIAAQAERAGANAVVVATDESRGAPMEELLKARLAGFEVTDASGFAARVLHRMPVDLVKPTDLVYGDGFVQSIWVRIGRRALSVSAALALLVLTAPIHLLAALLVKLDSPGPIFFSQERTGKDGRPFRILKLRTMTVNAEKGSAVWAKADDPRVTRVGKHLRRFRIDELPQLWNVLRGDMELVGPRPERPEFVRMLSAKIPFYDLRHVVPPGITGWAQVCYPYAASVEEAREKLQYDLYYVRHAGVLYDALILLLTARTILLGRGAR